MIPREGFKIAQDEPFQKLLTLWLLITVVSSLSWNSEFLVFLKFFWWSHNILYLFIVDYKSNICSLEKIWKMEKKIKNKIQIPPSYPSEKAIKFGVFPSKLIESIK